MNFRLGPAAVIVSIAVMVTGPAIAKKPDTPGNSGNAKPAQQQPGRPQAEADDRRDTSYFNAARLQQLRHYYAETRSSDTCPPGLAKKNNGCQAPGQAKKWRVGQTLPRDVLYYDLPGALVAQLGHTPEGQKIVRVGTDLLLISIGTGLVIEAVQDLDELF